MVVNTLNSYPFGEAFDPLSRTRPRPKAIMSSDSFRSLQMLQHKDLKEDKNLKHLAEELQTFIQHERLADFKPKLQIEIQVSQEVWFLSQLLLALFDIENVSPRSLGPSMDPKPKTEYDAVNVVLFALIHSSCMQDMVNNNLEGIKELSDGVVKKLKELKKKLTNYTAALDEVLQWYTFESNSGSMSGEMLEKIRKSKSGLKEIIKKMKPGKLKELLPNTKEITPDHILCSVLGIEEECAEWLCRMPEDIRNHQTDEYWVKRYLEDKANMLEDSIIEATKEAGAGIADDLASKFIALGFTEHRAIYLKQWLESAGEFQDHQLSLYWAKLYIEDVFKYDILLTDQVPRYPYMPDERGKWFEQEFDSTGRFWDKDEDDSEDETDEELEGATALVHPQTHPVSIINLKGLKDNSFNHQSKIKIPPESDDQHWVLFHGTDHLSAKSIIEEGILFRKGKNNQDFSGVSRKGFYLSPDYEWTKDWAGRRSASHSAVLIYKVPRKLLEGFELKAIHLSDNRDQWKEIVKHCRTDGREKLGKSKKEYKKASYIQGPICTSVPKLAQAAKEPPKGFERGNLQVCILDKEMAQVVGDLRHIYAVLFF